MSSSLQSKGTLWLSPNGIFSNGRLRPDCCLRVEDGVVTDIRPNAALDVRKALVPLNGILSSGLVDLQVNGGGGVLFNSTPTRAGIAAIIAAHRAFGTAKILPTVISDTGGVLERAVGAVIDSWGMPGLAGIHIEGPHISHAKRGTHAPDVLRPLDDHTLCLIRKLRDAGIPTMITVAPEVVSPDQIAQLAQTGAVVSLGHSDADYETTCAALKAGAQCFTHLFNAMSQMTSRAPGMIGAALTSRANAGMICDGHHVAFATLNAALSVEGAKDRMFFVSDAMPTVGGPGAFSLYDMEIRVAGGRLVNPHGSLAGAHVTMADSLARAAEHLDLSEENALRMGISIPATTIGLESASDLLGRHVEDMLCWSAGLETCRWLVGEEDIATG